MCANIISMKEADQQRRTGDRLRALRKQFERIAARRVGRDDVQDVVQEAMRIVAEKGIEEQAAGEGALPHLGWCFQVLRHTIGNHYRRERTRKQRFVSDSDLPDEETSGLDAPGPIVEAFGSADTLRLIEAAIADLEREQPQCGRYVSQLVAGMRPHEIATAAGLDGPVFYRRLYRCRQKLRVLLTARGVRL